MKNRACPKCKEAGHDKKDDHLYLMSDGLTWHCNKMYHTPYYERDGVEIPFSELGKGTSVELDDIDVSELPSAEIRGIPKDVIEKYGIKVEFSPVTGEPVKHYYPITMHKGRDIVGYKMRILPKEGFPVSPKGIAGKKIDPFGMRSCSMYPTTLVITEGELDACAAHFMMKGRFSRYMCISVPFGDNIKALLDARDYIDGIDDIIFCPDYDGAAGEELIDKICMAFPQIRVAHYTEKDACDMLKAGKKAEFLDALDAAKIWKPSTIVSVDDIIEEALKPVEWGLSYPWEGLTDMTYGCMKRSIIGIGAGPGAGKTSFVKAIQTHFIYGHKVRVGIISLEETPDQTLRSLGGYIIHKPVHLPDCVYDPAELRAALVSLRGRVDIYDHRGYRDWQDIQDTMAYMVHQGIRFIFIDPISALVAHLEAGDANTYLNNAMFNLSKMTQAMNFSVFHVNHLNNPKTGKDHGAGGRVYGSQFAGSRAMWKFSTELWGLERDQLSEDEDIRNTLRVSMIKSRLAGLAGYTTLKYDRSRGILIEAEADGAFLGISEEVKGRVTGSDARDVDFASIIKGDDYEEEDEG